MWNSNQANNPINTVHHPLQPNLHNPNHSQVPPLHNNTSNVNDFDSNYISSSNTSNMNPSINPQLGRRPSTLESINIWSSQQSQQSQHYSSSNSQSPPNSQSQSKHNSVSSTTSNTQFNSNIWNNINNVNNNNNNTYSPSFNDESLINPNLNRSSFNGHGINDLSPKVHANSFDLRRHSYGEVIQQSQPSHHPQFQQQQQQHSPFTGQFPPVQERSQSQSQSQSQFNQSFPHQLQPSFLNSSNSEDYNNTLELINEYFKADLHERVKVTLKFLDDHFFEEEQFLEDSYQLPKFPIEHSLKNYQLVIVGFKAGRIDVFYLPLTNELSSNLKIGDLVMVEADRGRDIGKVFKINISIDEARLMKLLQFQEQQNSLNDYNMNEELSIRGITNNGNNNSQATPTLHFPKSIIGLATTNEIIQILNKKQDEEKACRLCIAKISNSISSSSSSSFSSDLAKMKLIDSEYQFDRKKLTFYYSTTKRIDFRDLVRELFRIYKTRIWMCAVIGLPYIPNYQHHQSIVGQSKNQPQNHHQSQSIIGQSQVQGQGQNLPQQLQFSQFNQDSQLQLNNPFQKQQLFNTPLPLSFNNNNGINHGSFNSYSRPSSGSINSKNSSIPETELLSIDQYSQQYPQQFQSQSQSNPQNYPQQLQTNIPSSQLKLQSINVKQIPQFIPRKLPDDDHGVNNNNGDEELDNFKSGESFVLTSLVDSINY